MNATPLEIYEQYPLSTLDSDDHILHRIGAGHGPDWTAERGPSANAERVVVPLIETAFSDGEVHFIASRHDPLAESQVGGVDIYLRVREDMRQLIAARP